MRYSSSRDASDRIGGGLSRMTLHKADDLHYMQEVTLGGFFGEVQQAIEHAHPYGFTAVPNAIKEGAKECAEAFVSFMGGNRGHAVVVTMSDRRFRLFGLGDGEVGLHDDKGHQVHFRKDGIWVSAPNDKKVVMQVMKETGMPKPPKTGPSAGEAGGSTSSGGDQSKLGQGMQAGLEAFASIIMDKAGITFTHPGDVTWNIGGKHTIAVGGAHSLTAGGDISHTSDQGDVSHTAKEGDINVTSKKKNVNISSLLQNINISAPKNIVSIATKIGGAIVNGLGF